MAERVLQPTSKEDKVEDVFLRIAIYNYFKREETWEAIIDAIDGPIRAKGFDWNALYNVKKTGVLDERLKAGLALKYDRSLFPLACLLL